MSELLAFWVPLLGRALLHFLWQGAAIALLAACLLVTMRRASPQARYAVACFALLACALAPVLDVAWQLARGPAFAPAAARVIASVGATHIATPAPVAYSSGWAAGLDAWLPAVVAMWAAGACVFCLRMALGIAWIERLRRHPQPAVHALWQARLDALAAAFGPGRRVCLRMVDGIDSPVSAGWWRPVVLLPAAVVTRLPADLVEALLAHELAHVRRHDYLVNLLQGVVEALLFYHPAVWWLSRQVRIEREQVADRLAATALGTPRRLALALAELSELQCATGPSPRLAQAAHGGHLMSRIERLLRPDRPAAGGRIALPLLGAAAACVAFYAHAQFSSHIEPYRALDRPDSTARSAPAAPSGHRAAPLPVPAPSVRPVLDMPAAAPVAGADAIALAANTVVDGAGANAGFDPAADVDLDVDVDPGVDVERAIARGIERSVGPSVARGPGGPGSDGNDDAFAVVRKGQRGMAMSGTSRDAAAIESLRRDLPGDFLWFRHGGRAYTVTDPALVARADRAWQDSEAIGRQMHALGREMNAQGETLRAVGRDLARRQPRPGPSPAMHEAGQRINALARQQAALAAKQARLAGTTGRDDAEDARIEREIDAIDRQMDALGERIDRETARIEAEAERISRAAGPGEAFERRMEEAARPLEALGERMGELGERQQALATRAERETRHVIGEALDRGLARPAAAPARR